MEKYSFPIPSQLIGISGGYLVSLATLIPSSEGIVHLTMAVSVRSNRSEE